MVQRPGGILFKVHEHLSIESIALWPDLRDNINFAAQYRHVIVCFGMFAKSMEQRMKHLWTAADWYSACSSNKE